ncbi:MAG: alpha/beta hydrolase [Comamonas sp.]
MAHASVMSITTQSFRIATARGELQVQRWQTAAVAATTGATSGVVAPAPIVLLHDSLGAVALWRDFPAQLAQATQREVLAYDRLGFGLSDAAPGPLGADFVAQEAHSDFAALQQMLELQHFVVLGHSVGGGMAAHVAAAYPQQCVALVTESAQTFVEDRTLEGIRVARDQFAQPGQLERLSRYHGDKAAWVLSAWVDTWLSPAFADYRLQAALEQVRCPVLAIHGEQDEYGSLVHPRNIATWVPGAVEQEIVAGGGHVPHREQPERIVARIAQFLQPLA